MHFKFCPQCGAQLRQCNFGDDGIVPWCGHCQRPYFDIFPVVAITLVVNELGEAALLQQKYLSGKYYNFVSGYILPGETAEACARREVLEEIGVQVEKLRFVQSKWVREQDLLLLGFIASARKCSFVLSREVDKAVWVPAADARALVYPEGNITQTLLQIYLQEQGNRG